MLISSNILDILYALTIISGLILVVIILYRDYKNFINLFLAIATLFALGRLYFVYLVIKSNFIDSFWATMAYLSATPIPFLYLYFVKSFTLKLKKISLIDLFLFLPVPIIFYLFISNQILIGTQLLPNNTFREFYSPNVIFFMAYYVLYCVYAYMLLYGKYKLSVGIEKLQVLYVLLGTSIPLTLSFLINVFLPFLGIPLNLDIYALSPITTLILNSLVFLAIFKYKFMNFHYYLGRGLFFAILAAISSSIYFLVLFLLVRFFQSFIIVPPFFFNLVLFFVLIILLDPLRLKIEGFINRFFSRSSLDFDKTLSKVISLMDFSQDKSTFLYRVSQLLTEDMFLNGAGFLVYDDKKNRYSIEAADGVCKDLVGYTLTTNYPLIEYLMVNRAPLNKVELEKKVSDVDLIGVKKERILEILLDLEKIGAYLCVPGYAKQKLVLILILLEKKSKEPFTKEEIDFFITVANQVSVYLENLTLLEKEKESVRYIAESTERAKYAEELEKINNELIKTQEALSKVERFSTATKLTISLQHEINNPLTSVLAITQALLTKIDSGNIDLNFIRDKLKIVKNEAKRINQILEKLTTISEPIIREYMPGVEMIDINVSEKD